MNNLRKLLDEGKMHYFVSWLAFGGYRPTTTDDIIWIPAQGVINRHPFEFIKDQRSPTFACLVNWKEITEEEYELYSKTFKHS